MTNTVKIKDENENKIREQKVKIEQNETIKVRKNSKGIQP